MPIGERRGWTNGTKMLLNEFRFIPAVPSQRSMLHQWFEQKHIRAWMHGVGLQNTLDGLERFFQRKSDTTYWVGYD